MAQKILIVDDDLDTLKLVGTTLEREGFEITAANDGEKALQQVEIETPALILLDVMMPKMDGYEVTRRLKADPKTAQIPIILFTAKAQVDDKVEGLDLGADDYLTKPTHPAELVARVRAVLKRPATGHTGLAPDLAEETPHQSVAILSSKGGQGASTLAINLGVALGEATKQAVIVAELKPGRGDLANYLGFENSLALSELLRKAAPNIRQNDVEAALAKHKSGLKLLLSSMTPSDFGLLGAGDQFEAIARALGRIAPYSVLDLGVGLPDAYLRILPLCSRVIVIVEPNPTTLAQSKALIADLKAQGIDQSKTMIISINRVRTDTNLSVNDLERELGVPLTATYTPAPELAFQAARLHQAMVSVDPESFTAQQSAKVASLILEPISES